MATSLKLPPANRTALTDCVIVALWSGFPFGILEGIVHTIGRAYPAILASYKISPDILWAAPIVNTILFITGSLFLCLLLRFLPQRFSQRLFLLRFFLFLGSITVLTTPEILHPASAVILSLGIALAVTRKAQNSEERWLNFLRKKIYWIPLTLLLLWCGVAFFQWGRERFSALPPAEKNAPNVLIVVMDTVRYDRLVRPNGSSITPALNRIAARGIDFRNAWSTTSWSLPSQVSILTGRYPHKHQADWPDFRWRKEVPGLADFLERRGYATAAFSGNASWVTPEYMGKGFRRFRVYTAMDLFRRTNLGRKMEGLLMRVGFRMAKWGNRAPSIYKQLVKFLDDYPDHPFFAYICYMDVNKDFYAAKLNLPIKDAVAAYDRAVTRLDQEIDALIRMLQHRGVLNNTILVITSDHGESFGSEAFDHEPDGHGTSLYPEQLQVPLIIVYPGKIPAGRQVTNPVSIYSIPATVMQLIGIRQSPFETAGLLTSEYGQSLIASLTYDNHDLLSMVWNDSQYIIDRKKNIEELYDLSADPSARANLASSANLSPIRDKLRALLE